MQTQLSLTLEEQSPLDPDILYIGNENKSQWLEGLKEFMQVNQFALDLETYGEDKPRRKPNKSSHYGLNQWKGAVRLLQIGLPSGKVLVIDLGSPFADRQGIYQWLVELGFWSILVKKLRDSNTQVLVHNGKFDLLFLKVQYGIDTRNCFDTMLAGQLLHSGLPVSNSLGNLAQVYLEQSLEKHLQDSDWRQPKLTVNQINYAAKDVKVLFPLKEKLKAEINSAELDMQMRIENRFLPMLVEMMYWGMPIDVASVEKAIAQYEHCQSDMLQPFYDALGDVSHTADPTKLTQLLNEKLGLQMKSTSKDQLNLNSDIPAVKALQRARSLDKHIDYLKSLREKASQGRIRSDLKQIAPKGFGRTTSKEGEIEGVNLQQVPNPIGDSEIDKYHLPSIRSMFRAPKGSKLLIEDLSQAHLRIAAEASQDESLKDIYINNKDFHSITGSKLAHQQGIEWSPEQIKKWAKDEPDHENHKKAKTFRKIAKNVNFGGANIQGKKTLQATCRNAGTFIDLNTADDGIKSFRTLAPDLYNYQKWLHTNACKSSYQLKQDYAVTRSFSGRRVYLPKMPNDYNGGKPEAKISDVCSVHWTATEADIIKYALGNLLEDIDQHPEWELKPGILVHDEFDAEVSETYALPAATALKERMQEGMRLFIRSIPVDEAGATPEDCICDSWEDKD